MISNSIDCAYFFQTSFLFDYPTNGFPDKVNEVQDFLTKNKPEATPLLKPFIDFLNSVSIEEVQELFTRSFEVQAVTTLDLGYLLFGDDYKRAELLVNLSKEHKKAGNNCGIELADHLPNLLRLLSKMDDLTLRDELVVKLLGPALKKMLADFEPTNLESKNKVYKKHHKTIIDLHELFGLIYRVPLAMLYAMLEEDFELVDTATEKKSDFLQSIGQEMKIEG